MNCNCQSYNMGGGETPQVVLNPNKHFKTDNPSRNVSVDACIAPQVEYLWSQGVWTVGSCCGHDSDRKPHIIVDEGTDPAKAATILRMIDPGREWEVYQWQLVNCTPPVQATRCPFCGSQGSGPCSACGWTGEIKYGESCL